MAHLWQEMPVEQNLQWGVWRSSRSHTVSVPSRIVFLSTSWEEGSMVLSSACVDGADDLGAVEQEGTMNQGTMNQGTMNQGTMNQGTMNQGTGTSGNAGAVWGFRYIDWVQNGMHLKNTAVVRGRLSAQWDKTDACTTSDTSLKRSCGWTAVGVG
jgi:hypothetical protein